MDKKESWIKARHRLVVGLVRYPLGLYVRLKYGINMEPFRNQGDRAYLIVMNHQTGFDQFFVGLTFRRPVYYLATEDIFSMGWVSNVIRWLVAPIPIKKQTTDIQAVKNCIRVAREGGTICLAPEGNRTFHGKTVHMSPTIASLAKKLGLPIAIFRIEGGYGVQPRWSDVVRRGGMRSYVSRVIEPEEYSTMSNDELFQAIEQGLHVDEVNAEGSYPHKRNAEFLERAMYICPWCGLTTFESNGDVIHCKKCHRQIRHLPTKELEGITEPFPHRFVGDWYDWQNDYLNNTDLMALTEQPIYKETVQLRLVHLYKHKELLNEQATISLFGDRIAIDDMEFHFSHVGAVVVLGKNKLNIYSDGKIYQIKGDKRFNALKYVNFFHRYKNMTTGDCNGKFLGL